MHNPINFLFHRFLDHQIQRLVKPLVDAAVAQKIFSHSQEQYMVFGNQARLRIAPTAIVNDALFNLASGTIVIEDYVFFGHRVSVLTGTHDFNRFDRERQIAIPDNGCDIHIKRGAWIASNSTIIGPCTIGEHAVVSACALVNKDVPAFNIVAGIPARSIRIIRPDDAD